MQIQLRILVPGLLFAFSAITVHASQKAPVVTVPLASTVAQQTTPIDLTLGPAVPLQTNPKAGPLQLSLVTVPLQTSPMAPSLQSSAGNLATSPAAVAPAAPLDLSVASAELQRVARWVIQSRDNAGLPFLLIDKVNAQVFAFSAAGQLKGAAPVLLGMARGDRMLAPNNAPMSAMPPQVRITPAGRFVSRLSKDAEGKELLVLDYEAALSLHAVVKGTPKERRAERLKSVTAEDNRVSYGCINAPVDFYKTVVSPTFTNTKGIVYVLPETSPASAMFGFPPDVSVASGAQQGSTTLDARAVQSDGGRQVPAASR